MRIFRIAMFSGGVMSLGFAGAAAAAPPPQCDSSNFQNCLNGVSSSVTNGASLRLNAIGYGDVARKRTQEDREQAARAAADGSTGLAAGDAFSGLGAWLGYTRSDYEGDFVFAGATLAYDADADSFLIGLDRLFGDRFLVGLSAGYQEIDATTGFNGGGQEVDGFTIAPYAAWLINDTFSLDVTGGYSPLDYDQNRISPTDGTQTTASFDSDRWFVAGNLNALLSTGKWVMGGRVGFLHTEEDQDGYVETGSAASAAGGTLRTVRDRSIDLTQLVVGGDIAYSAASFEPYALLIYRNDLSRDNGEEAGGLPGAFTSVQADDDDEFQAGLGFRLFSDIGLTGTFEWSLIEGRESFDSQILTFTLRAQL